MLRLLVPFTRQGFQIIASYHRSASRNTLKINKNLRGRFLNLKNSGKKFGIFFSRVDWLIPKNFCHWEGPEFDSPEELWKAMGMSGMNVYGDKSLFWRENFGVINEFAAELLDWKCSKLPRAYFRANLHLSTSIENHRRKPHRNSCNCSWCKHASQEEHECESPMKTIPRTLRCLRCWIFDTVGTKDRVSSDPASGWYISGSKTRIIFLEAYLSARAAFRGKREVQYDFYHFR